MTDRVELLRRLDQSVHDYDALGWHRTGSRVEEETVHWLAKRAAEAGAQPIIETYSLERVDPISCYLALDDHRIDGLPLFDAGFTDEGGIVGRLVPSGEDGEIAVLRMAAGHGSGGQRVLRPGPQTKAMVVITNGDAPGLAPKNAHAYEHPSGPPVLQVSSEHGPEIMAWARGRRAGRIVVRADRVKATGYNLTLEILGSDPSLPPLVVMTPLTGWWHCAAERGGGVVCWLDVVRRLAADNPRRSVICLATGGHELGDLGLARALDSRPGLADSAFAWLRLGANIGAAQPGGTLVSGADSGLVTAVSRRLHDEGETDVEVSAGAGPSRQVHLRGRNRFFHLIEDRWPDAVDNEALARVTRAVSAVARELSDAGRSPTQGVRYAI